jgi:hypothetical protein
MQEILPGVMHWTRKHPKIGFEVSSYYLTEERVLIDPLAPAEGFGALRARPEHVLLTNRHHYRDCTHVAGEFGCTIWCVEAGLHEFKQGEKVKPFQFGDTLPGNIEAIEVGVICPDETALLIPRGDGILAVADGVVRGPEPDAPLSFVPDAFMGNDPTATKEGLKQAYRRVLERKFDHLLLAHGAPWIGGARAALGEFVGAAD